MKKLLLVFLLLGLLSCSSSNPPSSINPSSSPESTSQDPSIPTSDPNDVGGDNLQTDWEW